MSESATISVISCRLVHCEKNIDGWENHYLFYSVDKRCLVGLSLSNSSLSLIVLHIGARNVKALLFCRCQFNFVKCKEYRNYLFYGTHFSHFHFLLLSVVGCLFCFSGVSVGGNCFWLLSAGSRVVTVDCRIPLSGVTVRSRLSDVVCRVWLLTIGVGCCSLFYCYCWCPALMIR